MDDFCPKNAGARKTGVGFAQRTESPVGRESKIGSNRLVEEAVEGRTDVARAAPHARTRRLCSARIHVGEVARLGAVHR